VGRLITAELWSSLDTAPSGRGLVRVRIAPEAPLDIFAAVEQPDSVRMLLFGLPSEEAANSLEVPQARGIEITAIPTASDAGWGTAEIRLVDPRFAEVFTALADDLAEHVTMSADAATAVDRLVDRIRHWEAFLKVVDPDGLSSERRAGLYGELQVLRERLLPVSPELGISTWVGPSGAHQDFQASDWALEVKTSRTKEPVSVRISGERQLDDTGLAFLGLAHIGLEQRRHSGETLPDIVRSIRAMLSDTPFVEPFESQLLAAGYLAIHEPHYADDGYVVRFAELYRVGDGFPRIVERDLADGVGDIAYSLATSALGAFRLPWSEFTNHIRRAGSYD
jgi:Putative  PD-(D/E)XK family member, (DUF4420)